VADASPGGELVLASRLARLGAAIIDSIIVGAVIYMPRVMSGALGTAQAEVMRTNNPMARCSP
jgi:hypothetical protein